MSILSWENHTIPRNIIPKKLYGILEPPMWGKETTLLIIPKIISVELFKTVMSHISLDKNTLMRLPKDCVVTPNSLTTHYIKYDISDTYEITKHNDACNLTVIVYIYKDTNVKDEFYIDGNECTEEKWNINDDSYAVLAFNGHDEHWGKLEGKGSRKVLVFHYN